MIRALQKKFVITAMIAVTVLLLVVLGALNVFNAVSNIRQAEFLLDDLGRQAAFFPRTNGQPLPPPAAAGEAAEEDVLYEETAGETADEAAPDVTEEPVPEEDAALYDAENAEQAREAAEETADAGRSPYAALTLVLFAAGVVLLIAAAVLFMKNRRR